MEKIYLNNLKIFTALNAEKLKIGSRIIVANSIDSLRYKVLGNVDVTELIEVKDDSYERRFITKNKGCYPFAYLVSEPEELKWTDLKIGDIIRHKSEDIEFMVIGLDKRNVDDRHIMANNFWFTDDDLKEWEKVENCVN